MRILVVSDIHANWPALAAIQEPHDLCICLGDLVDYGPAPAECVQWAMKFAHHSIRGNHDHGVAQDVSVIGDSPYKYLTRVTRAGQWSSLSTEERRYLVELPLTQRFTIDGLRYLIAHGSPRDPLDEYSWNDPETWAERLKKVEADVVCVGHSHLQYFLKVNNTSIVNPGSVGQPRDGDPRAAYAVIDDGMVYLRRVEYPVEDTIAMVDASPWPDLAKEMLRALFREGKLPPHLNVPVPAGS